MTIKVKDYLTIKEAAELIGVVPNTLRNWDRAKKLISRRHPINNYRLYKREFIEKFLEDFLRKQ